MCKVAKRDKIYVKKYSGVLFLLKIFFGNSILSGRKALFLNFNL